MLKESACQTILVETKDKDPHSNRMDMISNEVPSPCMPTHNKIYNSYFIVHL